MASTSRAADVTAPPTLTRARQTPNDNRRFRIVSEETTSVRKFKLQGRKLKFIINEPPETENPLAWLKEGVRDVVHYITRDADEDDQVGVTFSAETLTENGWVSFRKSSQLTPEVVWDVISSVVQSNQNLMSDSTFELHLTKVKIPAGRGRLRVKGVGYETLVRNKKGIVSIYNNDNLCLARALVVGIFHCNLINATPEQKVFNYYNYFINFTNIVLLCSIKHRLPIKM